VEEGATVDLENVLMHMESKRMVEAVAIRFDVRGWSKSGVVDQPAEIDWGRSKVGNRSLEKAELV
jgi:hypothetical protein